MRFSQFAKGSVLAAAFLLPAGPVLAGAAPVINGQFIFQDLDQQANNCSEIEFDGEFFEAEGVVTGLGLSDDTVTISYDQDFVDKLSAKSDKGKIGQKTASELIIDILPGATSPTNAYTGIATPEKCSIQGRVKGAGSESRVKVSCQLGSGLSALAPAPDADQTNTTLAAFETRKDVKIKGNNGKVTIKQKGQGLTACGPFAIP